MTINYSKQILLKRGNTAVSGTYTGPVGEITLDTDLLQIRVHDGTTQGGWVIPSGQDFIDIQNDLAVIANVDTSLLANVSTLLANAASQQSNISSLYANAASQQTQLDNLVTAGNTDPATDNETFWFNTDDGRLYIKSGNLWTDASPTILPSPAYIFSTLENTAGNIVPDANNIYSLGSETAQWKDLWVSNATIYFDSVPLSTDVTGNLTYNGNPLVSFVDGNLQIGSEIVSGVGANTGNVTFDNTTIIGDNDSIYFQPNVTQPWLTWGIQNNVFGANSTALIAPASDDQHQGQIVFPGANGAGFGALAWAGNIGSPFDNSMVVAGLLGNVSIGTQDGITAYYWKFGTDGTITLPGGSFINGSDYDVDIIAGNDGVSTFGHISFTANGPNGLNSLTYNSLGEITVVTAGANDGLIKWVGNSSGDGAGYTTMTMVPDATVEGTDQYIIIDPTGGEPGHIHIRAGGTQDNSQAVLILGGETSNFRVESGLNPNVSISANSQTWTFGTDGNLTIPGNIGQPTANSGPGTDLYITAGHTLGCSVPGGDTIISSGLGYSPGEGPPSGNVRLRTAGELLNYSNTWNFAYDGNLVLPINGTITFANGVNILDTITGVTSINASVATSTISDASGDFSYGSLSYDYAVNGVTTGGFTISYSAPLVHGNVDVNVGNVIVTNIDAAGTIGANVIQVLSDLTSFGASPAPRIYGFSSIATTGSAVNEGNISASGNLVASQNAYVTGNVFATNVSVSGNLTVDNTLVNRVYLLEAYASETYTLPDSFTEDVCRYSVVSNAVNVPSAWFNTSTYTFTPLKAGYWEITAAYDVYRNAESSMAIKKNTSIVASAGSFNAVAQQVTKIIYLNGSTDYIQIYNYGGAALSRSQYDGRSWFQARWVGA